MKLTIYLFVLILLSMFSQAQKAWVNKSDWGDMRVVDIDCNGKEGCIAITKDEYQDEFWCRYSDDFGDTWEYISTKEFQGPELEIKNVAIIDKRNYFILTSDCKLFSWKYDYPYEIDVTLDGCISIDMLDSSMGCILSKTHLILTDDAWMTYREIVLDKPVE